MRLLGHRGASADALENTLEAFRLAMAQGADGVELDARPCGSGEVVVFHDATLDRLAGRPGRLGATPWTELRQVELRTGLASHRPRIPLLQEVLEALPPPARINVELKSEGWLGGGWVERVGRLLAPHADRVVVSSFDAICLARLALSAPRLARGYLVDPDRSWLVHGQLLARLVGRDAVHPADAQVTARRVARWHRAGRQVAVWTVDDVDRARTLAAWGVDTLITNRPGLLRAALSG